MSGSSLNAAWIPLADGAEAVYNSSGLAYDRHPDWLGSSRLSSTQQRGLCFDTAYSPYGIPYSEIDTTNLDFTGQDANISDTPEILYDFLRREYSPVQGRWLSPDPSGLAAANPNNPQSWNRYSYVDNNPLALTDPNGLDCFTPGGRDLGGLPEQDCNAPNTWIGPFVQDVTVTGSGSTINYSGLVLSGGILMSGGGFDWGYFIRNFPLALLSLNDPNIGNINRCAAGLANSISIAGLKNMHGTIAQGLLGNTVSSASQLIFGPNHAAAAGQLVVSAATNAGGAVTRAVANIPVDSGFQSLFTTIAPTSFGETALGAPLIQTAGSFFSFFSSLPVQGGKLFYDAGTYSGGLAVCAEQGG